MTDLIKRLKRTLPGIQSPAMRGDNLAITLASFFEPQIDDEEMNESGTWKQGAVDAANEVLNAIHAHYADRLTELEAQLASASTGGEQWQSIDTAPKDGSEIILHDRGTVGSGFYSEAPEARRAEAGWFWEDDRGNLVIAKNADPAHWRPLPAPPSPDQREG